MREGSRVLNFAAAASCSAAHKEGARDTYPRRFVYGVYGVARYAAPHRELLKLPKATNNDTPTNANRLKMGK